VEAILALRDELRDVVDVQVTVLTGTTTPDGEVRAALSMGADLVGGCPHLADDPDAETRRLLGIAERAGVPVDLHTDERLDPSVCTLRDLADEVAERSFPSAVTASHCVSLGLLDPPELAEVIDGLLRARIGVVTLPLTNLYLQGRDRPQGAPRGLTALRALLDAGVPLAAGGDNLRDPFNPMGRGDPMEVASLLVTAGHLHVAEAYRAVSDGAREVLGLSPAGPAPVQVADLLAIRADGLAEAVGGGSQDRVVIRRGRVVSTTTVEHHGFSSEPAQSTPKEAPAWR
jgi:cytosine deaminase